jgi:mycothiol synthase
MLAAGLAYLGGRGLPTAMLYVDADNAAANRLYESFGFTVDHHDRAYVIDVAGEAGEANVVGEQ